MTTIITCIYTEEDKKEITYRTTYMYMYIAYVFNISSDLKWHKTSDLLFGNSQVIGMIFRTN